MMMKISLSHVIYSIYLDFLTGIFPSLLLQHILVYHLLGFFVLFQLQISNILIKYII